jgi:hypothetical protein
VVYKNHNYHHRFVVAPRGRMQSQNDERNEYRTGRLFQASCMDAGYFNFEIWDDIMIIKRAIIQEAAGGSYLSCCIVIRGEKVNRIYSSALILIDCNNASQCLLS